MPKNSENTLSQKFFTMGKSINFYHLFARAVTTFIMPFCLFIRIKL